MSFDWLSTSQVTDKHRHKTTTATHEAELAARAFLLARLGYTKAEAERRLRQNLAWEYEQVGKAAALKKVASIVSDAYHRAGVSAAQPPGRKRKR